MIVRTVELSQQKSLLVTKKMDTVSFNVQKEVCAECCLALQRFIGTIDGVDSILVADGKIDILFDKDKIPETDLAKVVRNSMQKLGYRMLDES